MAQNTVNRINELEAEKMERMVNYSSMRACAQDFADKRINEIDAELETLRA